MATSSGVGDDQNQGDTSTSDEFDVNPQTSSTQSSKKKLLTKIKMAHSLSRKYWDPLDSADWDQAGPPGPLPATRIRRDISSIFKEPLPGIMTVPDEDNMCLVHCLLLGSCDTPYEGGFFHFLVRFGPSYPMDPPRVRLITTHRGTVRFNPNLYSSGRVCLSILGTWSGPAWSPASNLGSLLLSIQSIMNDKPYYNEPGFMTEQFVGQSDQYNLYLTYETLRVAVCCQMESILMGKNQEKCLLPKELNDFIKTTFLEYYEHYVDVCERYKHLDGQLAKDAFSVKKKFDFENILKRLKAIKEAIFKGSAPNAELANAESLDSPPSSLSSVDEDQDQQQTASTSGSNSEPKDSSMDIISEANEFIAKEEDSSPYVTSSLNDSGDQWLLVDSEEDSAEEDCDE